MRRGRGGGGGAWRSIGGVRPDVARGRRNPEPDAVRCATHRVCESPSKMPLLHFLLHRKCCCRLIPVRGVSPKTAPGDLHAARELGGWPRGARARALTRHHPQAKGPRPRARDQLPQSAVAAAAAVVDGRRVLARSGTHCLPLLHARTLACPRCTHARTHALACPAARTHSPALAARTHSPALARSRLPSLHARTRLPLLPSLTHPSGSPASVHARTRPPAA